MGIKGCVVSYENENMQLCFCKWRESEVAIRAYAEDECTTAL